MLAALLNTKTPSLRRALVQSIKSGSGRCSRIKRVTAQVHCLAFWLFGHRELCEVRASATVAVLALQLR